MRLGRIGMALLGAVAAALSVTATATAAPGAQEPPADSPYIIDGGFASNAPWAARLFSNGRETCSASVITQTWVLTAQHCVTRGGISIGVGNLDQTQTRRINATQVIQHPSADLALVQLASAANVQTAPLGDTTSVRTNQTVQVYGWGATCTNQSEANCQSQRLKVADVRVTSVSCSDYRGGVAVCASRGNGITAGGDSGGPMFSTSPADGRYLQVGVASTSDRSTRTAYTNITRYRSWIQGIAGV